MSQRTLIIIPKRIVSSTKWAGGAIPRRNVPFLREAFPQGRAWRWRSAVLESNSGSQTFSLLVQMRVDKPNYKAWLAVSTPDGYAMVARYECHGNHGGLHCHLLCGQETYPPGEIDPAGLRSFPHWKRKSNRKLGRMSEETAWHIALKFFRVGSGDIGTLL